MIIFETYHYEVFNHLIHHFLELEVFNDETDIGDIIEELLPKYLYREQYLKCVKKFEDIFHWTEDQFFHEMDAFHELLLYKFLGYMACIQKDISDFKDIYFNVKGHKLIEAAAWMDLEEDGESTLQECKDLYYEVFCYPDLLFEDTDFLLLGSLYNNRYLGDTSIEYFAGINIDYYFELLPLDIQEHYKTKHITLTSVISDMLQYLDERMKYGSLYKLLWEGDDPVKEDRVQLILENIMDAYFYNQEIEITREAQLGNGRVDFKLYKNKQEDEKILIELKRASSSYLKKGYEQQLTNYMKSSNYKNAFYLIACFTDQEYEKTVQFIRNHIYTDTVQLYINIKILDCRKRNTASQLHKTEHLII